MGKILYDSWDLFCVSWVHSPECNPPKIVPDTSGTSLLSHTSSLFSQSRSPWLGHLQCLLWAHCCWRHFLPHCCGWWACGGSEWGTRSLVQDLLSTLLVSHAPPQHIPPIWVMCCLPPLQERESSKPNKQDISMLSPAFQLPFWKKGYNSFSLPSETILINTYSNQ